MAQAHTRARARRGGRFRRRFGCGAPPRAAVAALLLLGALLAAAVLWRSSAGGFVIERDGEQAQEAAQKVASDEDASAGTDSEAQAQAEVAADSAEAETLVVHVDGAVACPGVYELASAARVVDAVQAAGGLTEEASTTSLNLAAPLTDGQKVYVPTVEEASDQASDATGTSGAVSSSTGSAESVLVNINLATAEELCELPGVGEATAAAIIQDREQNGPFTSVEDIMRVSGIGEKKFAKMEAMICV